MMLLSINYTKLLQQIAKNATVIEIFFSSCGLNIFSPKLIFYGVDNYQKDMDTGNFAVRHNLFKYLQVYT